MVQDKRLDNIEERLETTTNQDMRLEGIEKQLGIIAKSTEELTNHVNIITGTVAKQSANIHSMGQMLLYNQEQSDKTFQKIEKKMREAEKKANARAMKDAMEERSPTRKSQRQYSPEKGATKTTWDEEDGDAEGAETPAGKNTVGEFDYMDEETDEVRQLWASHPAMSAEKTSDTGNDGAATDK